MDIQILKDDPAYPFLDALQHRKEKGLDVITIADTFHNLLSTLHKTSTQNRPPLNGTSRQVVLSHLKVTKGMLSQYMTITKNIQSQQVKQEIKNNRIWLIDVYYLSKVRGKNQEETEKLQLKEIQKITENRKEIKLIQISKGKADELNARYIRPSGEDKSNGAYFYETEALKSIKSERELANKPHCSRSADLHIG